MSLLLSLLLVGFSLSVTMAEERPNILFCIADDASFPHMGAYGTEWIDTPGFDRVASEGVLFTRAYTPNAKCAPSRSCVLTGRNSWQLEAGANHWGFFPAKYKTYVEALSARGYFVGKTGKGWGPGIAVDAEGKRRRMAGQPFDRHRAKPPANGISPNDYARNFATFLKAKPQGQPFCFWYGGLEPHRRYEYGSGVRLGKRSVDEVDRVPTFWPDNETTRNDLLDYGFEIEHFDRHLSRMLDLLDESGQLDNTIVVVTADNGMPFPRVKGQEYELSNHLPLAIMWPRGIERPGRVIDDYVSFIDFAPTFLEVAGVSAEEVGMQPVTGESLLPIFRSNEAGRVVDTRDHVLIGKERHDIGRPNDWGYPIRGIVKDDLLLIKNFEPNRWPAGNPETGYLNTDGSPTKTRILSDRRVGKNLRFWELNFGKRPATELYDVKADPFCMTNLADDPEWKSRRQELETQLVTELKAQQDPRMLGKGAVFDAYPYADKKTVRFYERYIGGEKLRAGWVDDSDFEPQPLDD